MLRLALQNDPALEVSTIEIQREPLSYTIDTINSVKLQFPECELSLILGRDNLTDLDSWKDSRKIMECCHVLVGSRPGVETPSVEKAVLGLFGGNFPYTPGEPENDALEFYHCTTGRRLVIHQIVPRDISSSIIRGQIAGSKPVGNLLPPGVEIYIMDNHLYQA
jgi:nicotinate-nucleotide adenylyltransferase